MNHWFRNLTFITRSAVQSASSYNGKKENNFIHFGDKNKE